MSTAERCYPELRERAVRMVREQRSEYSSEWATMRSIAEKPAARPRRCASGYGGRSATRARARAGRATSGSGSRRWNGRIGSSGGRTRSCARPRLFSRRRNSAAARSDAGIHRPASGGLRGSSRSARSCRSPRRRTMHTRPDRPTRRGARPVSSATRPPPAARAAEVHRPAGWPNRFCACSSSISSCGARCSGCYVAIPTNRRDHYQRPSYNWSDFVGQ